MADKLYPVKLERPYLQYNPGEIAGFDEKTTAHLVEHGIGVVVDASGKPMKFAPIAPAAAAPAKTTVAASTVPAEPPPAKKKK